MAYEVASPFTCGGSVKSLSTGNWLIRSKGTGTLLHVCINGTPNATSAHFYLLDNESIQLDSDYDINFLNITGDPNIYATRVKRVP